MDAVSGMNEGRKEAKFSFSKNNKTFARDLVHLSLSLYIISTLLYYSTRMSSGSINIYKFNLTTFAVSEENIKTLFR